MLHHALPHPAASRPHRRRRLCLLLQLASAVAIEEAGGPFIPLRLGRKDAQSEEECTPDGRLPNAAAPFPDKAANPAGVGAWLPPASHPVLLLAHCCCCCCPSVWGRCILAAAGTRRPSAPLLLPAASHPAPTLLTPHHTLSSTSCILLLLLPLNCSTCATCSTAWA
jgi:hypothetical protein